MFFFICYKRNIIKHITVRGIQNLLTFIEHKILYDIKQTIFMMLKY